MSNLLKNKFLEKKFFQNINESSYTLIFHYTSISSSEWKKIKEKIFEVIKLRTISGSAIETAVLQNEAIASMNTKCQQGLDSLGGRSLVIPRHIFNKFLKLCNSTKPSEVKAIQETHLQSLGGSIGGSSSLFFCQNLKEVAEILKILDTEAPARFSKEKDRSQNTHTTQFEISKFKDFPQFINLGLFCHTNEGYGSISKFVYYNTYELHDLLEYTLIIDKKITFSKFISLLEKNEQVVLNEVVNRVFFLLKILNLAKLSLILLPLGNR
jgi:hypothetical protein